MSGRAVKCQTCFKAINDRISASIDCKLCGNWTYKTCTGFNTKRFQSLALKHKKDPVFICSRCPITSEPTEGAMDGGSASSSVRGDSSDPIADLARSFHEFSQSTKDKLDKLLESGSLNETRLLEVTSKVKNFQKDLKDIHSNLEVLRRDIESCRCDREALQCVETKLTDLSTHLNSTSDLATKNAASISSLSKRIENVPTKSDVEAVNLRVTELTEQLGQLKISGDQPPQELLQQSLHLRRYIEDLEQYNT